jgi:RNA polymerase sigma factor (sigma-70 family)
MPEKSIDPVLRHIRHLTGTQPILDLTDGQLLERFTTGHEEAAFDVLLQRHGSMVLGLCRRLLRHPHDAEDAFQAAFLVLVRKCGALDKNRSLGPWLYTVAYRIARRAQVDAARRVVQESQAAPPAATLGPSEEVEARDFRAVLDKELSRLPEKYRAPLILCYLEGQTNAEAARQLGWTKGTVSGRLARARELLRERLARRGWSLSLGLLATELTATTAAEVIPVGLARETAKAAALTAAGAGGISIHASALADGALQAMAPAKTKTTLVLLLVLGTVTAGAGVWAHQTRTRTASEAESSPAKPKAPVAKGGRASGTDFSGDSLPAGARVRLGSMRLRHEGFDCVLSPDGKLLASAGRDATVRLWDVATGKELRRLAGHQEYAYSVAFSPNGKLLASGDLRLVHLWDVATGRAIRTLPADFNSKEGLTVGIYGLAFSPDGNILAVGEGDLRVRLWDTVT